MYVLQLEIEGTADFALYDRVLVNIKVFVKMQSFWCMKPLSARAKTAKKPS
jgi:hypothetical protein